MYFLCVGDVVLVAVRHLYKPKILPHQRLPAWPLCRELINFKCLNTKIWKTDAVWFASIILAAHKWLHRQGVAALLHPCKVALPTRVDTKAVPAAPATKLPTPRRFKSAAM